MTPYELEILIHHHVTSKPFPRETDLYWQTIDWMNVDVGAVELRESPPKIRLTDLGRAWLADILSTAPPEKRTVYINTRGEEVKPI